MKLGNLSVFLGLIFILSACGNKNDDIRETPESKVIRVNTVKVTMSDESGILKYSGSAEPSVTVPLSFKNAGTVEKVYVDEGDFVKKGQLLATLDKTDMENLYQVSLSKYKQAKDAYDRLKTVHDEGGLPEIKWVEMETGYAQAKASLDLAENNLSKCDLRAPSDGIIGKRSIEPGQSTLGINLVHIELVELNTVNIKVSVPENEISKIKKGQEAVIYISALNNRQFEGLVSSVSPVAEMMSRTYTIKITVKNPGQEIKPGMVCDVSITNKPSDNMVTVPYNCVTEDKNGSAFVYIVDTAQKKVHKQVIQTGNYFGSMIEVLSGLMPGQLIVSDGKEKLSDNSLIVY